MPKGGNANTQVIGVDIGGTGIKGGIVHLEEGELVGDPLRVETPRPAAPEPVAEALGRMVEEISDRDSAPDADTPIGVTFPGIIQHGVARSAANVDESWIEFEVDKFLSERLGRPVEVINDADAAGLAEVRYGAGKGVDGTVLVVTLGTGIGSALVFNGHLVPNTELGHLEIDGFDAESKASAVAREREGIGWEDYSVRLQRYFSHLEFLLSPELFIVGGGISERADEYLPRLKLRTPIITAELKNEAGIVGCALQAAIHNKLAE